MAGTLKCPMPKEGHILNQNVTKLLTYWFRSKVNIQTSMKNVNLNAIHFGTIFYCGNLLPSYTCLPCECDLCGYFLLTKTLTSKSKFVADPLKMSCSSVSLNQHLDFTIFILEKICGAKDCSKFLPVHKYIR